MFEPDEIERPSFWNFDDCGDCKNNRKRRICGECDNGEFYEEPDMDGLDTIFAS